MKMRFWQKTFIFTLILFLVCLNMGILSLAVYTYKKNVETTEAAVTAQQSYIAMSFERDYNDLMELSSSANPSLLIQSFGSYYGSKGLYIAFEEGGNSIFSNFKNDYHIEDDSLTHIDFDGKRHIIISSNICGGKYNFVLAKNVESLDSEFASLMLMYTITAACVSVLLAVCLYFILKKLSEPLEKLRKTTEVIEAGDFSVTAEEKGNDEFTLLAKSFNAMLSKINEQMSTLEQEAKKKQMLVDNMAHELRTPLTSIHGYAEYIEKANTTEERRLIASKYIMSESERLLKISEILLDGAFIRGNDIEMKEIDLAEILKDISEKLQYRAEKSNVRILCHTKPVKVFGNETLLSMLFYNLTENAIKAGEDREVNICCCENYAIIEDKGKGMTKEQLSHITEPFYRTDRSRSRAEGGAGLGLALCRQIAETHNAEMQFESEIGKGTKVSVIFTSRQ